MRRGLKQRERRQCAKDAGQHQPPAGNSAKPVHPAIV